MLVRCRLHSLGGGTDADLPTMPATSSSAVRLARARGKEDGKSAPCSVGRGMRKCAHNLRQLSAKMIQETEGPKVPK